MRQNPNEDCNAIIEAGIAELKNGDTEKAIAIFHDLIIAHPENSLYCYYMGEAYFKNSDFTVAAEYFIKSIELKPTERAYIKLALSFGELNEFNRSVEYLKDGLTLFPDSADLYSYLGVALRSLDHPFESIESFWHALKINKNHLGANWGLGVTYGIVGDRNKSIQYLREAVKINPDFAPPHFHLAMNYLSYSDLDAVKEEYKILKKLSPSYARFLKSEMEKFRSVY